MEDAKETQNQQAAGRIYSRQKVPLHLHNKTETCYTARDYIRELAKEKAPLRSRSGEGIRVLHLLGTKKSTRNK